MSDWRVRLARLLEGFNDDEGEAVLFIARRLQRGRSTYGPLDLKGDDRNWAQEEREEHADAMMYRAFAEITRLRRGRDA